MSSKPDLNGAANLARSEFDRITIDKIKSKPVQSYFNQESPSTSFGPSPIPAISSETRIGFQTTASPDHALQFSTALRTEERYSAASSFPLEASQVKMDTNEDVIRRLKTQISGLKAEKKASRTALDEMLSDLLAAQRDVQDKASIIAAKDAETAAFEEEKKQMFQEYMAVRKQFAELSITCDEKSTRLRAAEMSVLEQKENAQESQAKALVLQQEVDYLISRLDGVNVMDHSSAIKAEKLKTEQHLRKLEEVEGKMEQYARDLSDERSRTAQVTQWMRDLEAAQLVAAQNAPDTNAMKDMQLKHDTQIAEFRRMLKFFKENSEQLSRELRATGQEQQRPMPGTY
jgi:chromosome segregation ATPase